MSKEKRTKHPESKAVSAPKKQCTSHYQIDVTAIDSFESIFASSFPTLQTYLQDDNASLVDTDTDQQQSLSSMLQEPIDHLGLNKADDLAADNQKHHSVASSSSSSHTSPGFFSPECRHYDKNKVLDDAFRFMFNHSWGCK